MSYKVVFGPSRICFGRGEVRSSFIQSSQVNSVRKQSHPLFFHFWHKCQRYKSLQHNPKDLCWRTWPFQPRSRRKPKHQHHRQFHQKPVLTSRGESFAILSRYWSMGLLPKHQGKHSSRIYSYPGKQSPYP